jgi:WS/DGAT/MGAT family acyltransferase
MAAKRSGESMSKVDTAWLRMDSASNLMAILGVWTLQPRVPYEDVCRRMEERLLAYERFRQRVEEDATGARWVDHEVDIHEHVVREKLERHRHADAQAALQHRIGELAMEPLDRARPLWKMHLVEDYDGGSALIVRIHHCIADGVALILVTLGLVDGGGLPPRRERRRRPDGVEEWLAHHLVQPLAGLAVKALDAAGENAAKALAAVLEPKKGARASLEVAHLGYQLVNDALALLLMPDDTPTRLKGKPGTRKRVAWCAPLPLDEVKEVGKALGCSNNDVVLACVAGAIGHYLRSKGDDVTGVELRAMVPVNLRAPEHAWKLGNHFGLVPLLLPVGIANPVERVYEVRRRMNALKGSTQPLLAFAVLAVAGLLVKPAQDAVLDLFRHKATAVMTNVPGPREHLKFLGATIEENMFWVPQSGDIGLGVSVLSYAGGVQFGVISDTLLCPDPEHIIDGFAPEFERLALLTMMLPWPD